MDIYIDNNAPDTAVIEIGSNDLCGPDSVTTIARSITSQSQATLRRSPWLKCMMWCHVTERLEVDSAFKDLDQYNKDVKLLNTEMTERIKHIPRMSYWCHSELADPTRAELGDGVHPCTARGKQIYRRSISSACKAAKLYSLRHEADNQR